MVDDSSLSLNPSLPLRLSRTLSALETWGFGLTGHMLWISVIPAIHAALGVQAIFVWIPATLFGMVLNYQVKRLGAGLVDVAGGTPNYATYLLKQHLPIARYAAIGYYFSWVSVLPVNAIVLTDLIKVNLESFGVDCPERLLVLAFTLLPFVLAFSGTRALSILHLFFVLPAVGLLMVFCGQGLGWLALSPDSPGFFPDQWSLPSFVDWAKWFLFVSYATYACETTSAFIADSRKPENSLNFLGLAAWFMPPIFIGCSWVVMRLAVNADLQDSAFLNLVTAALPFWGKSAALGVTFLLAAGCLLSCATVVSSCPRMIYQLALDGYLSPVFGVVSRRGVLGPALTITLVFSLGCVFWGNLAEIVAVGNIGWLASILAFHLGLWLQRDKPQVLLPGVALGLFLLEVAVLLVGGFAWGWQACLIGGLIPLGILGVDALAQQIPVAVLQPDWWIKQYQSHQLKIAADSIMLQVLTLIFLLCGAVLVGWLVGTQLQNSLLQQSGNLVVVLLLVVAFVGVAIACWTSLPQVVAIAEAREAAEQAEAQVREQARELEDALHYVQQTQSQLVQAEKMSSLGQLVAGVAHEINNPVNFIYGNLSHANQYIQDLLGLLQLYQQYYPQPVPAIETEAAEIEVDFLAEDLPKLLDSMKVGAERIRQIVVSLRNFSRSDESAMRAVNIHEGIDSTLMILQNRLKARPDHPGIQIVKEYGELPAVECYAGQLNQVFMNILSNAIDALEERDSQRTVAEIGQNPSVIRIITEAIQSERVWIRIADNGAGIPEAVQKRLFEPFFTTKTVGKGTGLGLSISYDIVTGKHGGLLKCVSSPSCGTEFVIEIPLRQGGLG